MTPRTTRASSVGPSEGAPCASILIATYEHPEYLRRTLLAFSRQTVRDFEVVICDDGSGSSVRNVIRDVTGKHGLDVRHCWHEKAGFRKCRILNEGVIRARGDYLIFADADCIPHRRFVEAHIAGRSEGRYQVGRRVMLDESITTGLDDGAVLGGQLESPLRILLASLQRHVRHGEEGILYPAWIQRVLYRRLRPLLGCNFSCWREDLIRINGFDEDFIGAGGGEDDDVERRFCLTGLRAGSVRGAAICYHQYHKLVPRGPQAAAMCEQKAMDGNSTCRRGLREHEAETQREMPGQIPE